VEFFIRRLFFRGDAEAASGPFAEINQLAAFTAKRTVRIAREFGCFFAGRTLHIRVICG